MKLPESIEKHVDRMVDHYARMAIMAGWLDYTRARVSELQKEDKMYANLGARIKKRIEELKSADHS
jgi:hypothetical protein